MRFFLLVTLFFRVVVANAGDTLKISLNQAEKIFWERNLLLLAQKFNIEQNRALEIQAGLVSNPNLHLELGGYNPNTHESFNLGPKGQQLATLSQLIHLAGQRHKSVIVAQFGTKVEEARFYDILRTLKFTLRSTLFSLHYSQKIIGFYREEIPIIRQTIRAYEIQREKGNLPLKEVVRLKSLLFSLETELHDEITNQFGYESDLNILMHSTGVYYSSIINNDSLEQVRPNIPELLDLQQTAKENRSDLKVASGYKELAVANLRLQKSLAIPDITFGGTLDRGSNYIQNYKGINLDVPLVLFNRNQGNIKVAKAGVSEAEAQYQQQLSQVENEVVLAYNQLNEIENSFRSLDITYKKDFDQLIDGIIENFKKRNIGLVEFIDYYESYKQNTIGLFRLNNQKMNARENLNFSIGTAVL